ncbi:unnamed protein product [Phaedon cochleariae]|uniref:Lipase domain-containing protein n=1 Tax=Phaedon cochleariae TaxID=80249 RepID=A0A9N9WZF3_PHACE|nr:unnamed protein product [Phaedon cochleariae]
MLGNICSSNEHILHAESNKGTRKEYIVSNPTYINVKGQYGIEDLTRQVTSEHPQESDIQLYFHVRNGSADGIKIYTNDSEGIRSAGFSKEKNTLIVIHGWHDQYDSPVIRTVSKAALEVQDFNVFAVDWSKIASKDYDVVFPVVPEVGRLLGKLIKRLVDNNGLNLARTTVAGHSLGSHVAGAACAHLGSECDVIIGMDPAGPQFSYDKTENRLDTSDAKFVQVIHTNAGLLGFPQAIGHADYFLNGGSDQPGCESDTTGWCSHNRAFFYYAESLTTGNFVALKCDNNTDYENGKCAGQSKSFLGQYQVDKSNQVYIKSHEHFGELSLSNAIIMKGIIFYFIVFYSAYASPSGQHNIEDVTREVTSEHPQESDIQLYFHVRDGSAEGIEIYTNDSEGIRSAGFSEEKNTLIIIHGWHDQYNSPVIRTVSKAALEVQDFNVFAVDWSKIASKDFEVVFPVVPEVGRLLGKLIKRLVDNNGLSLARTTVAGHSLGSHVAGAACAHVGSECDVIIGMDPAGAQFFYDNIENRLNTSDAKFVQVIHTNAGLLGFSQAIGHADYFLNGGSDQPGCESDTSGWCSHNRAFFYYAESLTTGDFVALKCDNNTDYENGRCNGQSKSFMGQYQVDKSARGNYFLKTHSSPPYAVGDNN